MCPVTLAKLCKVAIRFDKPCRVGHDRERPTGLNSPGKQGNGVSTKIRNNLWQVGGTGLTHPSDAAVYLVRFGDKAALIDAGSGGNHPQLIKNIAECLESNVQLEYILLTHCHFDHAGGAHAVREEYGSRIVAHELDAIYLESGDNRATGAVWYGGRLEPFTVDIRLQGRESTIAIGSSSVTAIHCPGHSPGSVAYTTEIEGQLILFGQDIHGPLHSEFLSDEKLYLDSLGRLLDLQADLLLEGHFGIIETKEEVRAFIEYWRSPVGVSHYAILYAPDEWRAGSETACDPSQLLDNIDEIK
jgi:glyoxylase-like metal-dependent hydrolase (beta-lactamase superfamily II)